jgi:hypothetical protein
MKRYGIWVGREKEYGSWVIDQLEVPKYHTSFNFKGKFVSEFMGGGSAPTIFKKGKEVDWENYHNLVDSLEEAYKEVIRQLYR